MVTQMGVVGTTMTGVAIIAIDNVVKGHDPFPQLLVGGILTTALSMVSEVNVGIAFGVAVTFLTATIVLHSKSFTDVLAGVSGTPVYGPAVPKKRSSTKGNRNV